MNPLLKYLIVLLVSFVALSCVKPVPKAARYTIAASAIGSGSICPPGSSAVDSCGVLRLVFTPNTGYHVDSVYVADTKVDSLKSFTFNNVSANHVIVVFFNIDRFTITTSVVGNGSVSPSDSVRVIMGGSQKFVFTAGADYHVEGVYLDNARVDSLASYTLNNVSANHTIAVYFGNSNYAIRFDGNGSNVQFPPAPGLRLQSLTVEMYVRVDSFVSPLIPFLWETNLDQWSYADGFSIKWEEGLIIFHWAKAANLANSVGKAFSILPGQWTHLACTFSWDTVRILVNGAVLTEVPIGERIYYGTHGFSLGIGFHSQFGGLNYFQGLMDEIRIWNYPRTSEQIRQAMNLRLRGNETGLVGYWNCDQDTAVHFLQDKTRFNHDALINGNVTFVRSDAFGYRP